MNEMEYLTTIKPLNCPYRRSIKIADILYGLIRLTYELKKEIDEGKWILGGCLTHPALPKWLCNTCNARMYKPYEK